MNNLKIKQLWQDHILQLKICPQERVDLMEKAAELKSNLKHKSFLVITKYIPHISALYYIIYTLFQFADIDLIALGYLFSFSLLPWMYILLNSYVYRYCYVHRLPLYYILVNDILTTVDYYLKIPINEFKLLVVHLLLIGFLIFGYTYYYIKYKK